jgi:hypothetical protein
MYIHIMTLYMYPPGIAILSMYIPVWTLPVQDWWILYHSIGCEDVHTSLYHVHTYKVHSWTCMYIHIYIFMNVYVPCTYNYLNSCTCTYTFMKVWNSVYMYVPCTYMVQTCMYRFDYLRQVGRIPDAFKIDSETALVGSTLERWRGTLFRPLQPRSKFRRLKIN